MPSPVGDMAIPFDSKFAWGRLPSGSELARLLGPRAKGLGAAVPHWLDNFAGGPRGRARSEGVGLIELCLRFQSIELWIDPDPSAQLMLLKLLDFLRSDAEVVGRLFLCQANVMIGNMRSEALADGVLPP